MDEIQKEFFDLLTQSIGKTTTKKQYTNLEQVYLEFQKRKMCPLVYDTIRKTDVNFESSSFREGFKKSAVEMAISYHLMFAFYAELQDWLHQNRIQYVLLKGFSLATLYPQAEMRTFQDVDIYIPDWEQFQLVEKHFSESGYHASEKSTGHHTEYYAPMPGGGVVKCELHQHLISEHMDKKTLRYIEDYFANVVKNNTYTIEIMDRKIPVLPPTENLCYLFLHMIHHFLGYGIGIYPLIDITLFWEQNRNSIDMEALCECFRRTKCIHFAKYILHICREQLQMDENPALDKITDVAIDATLADKLLKDLWEYEQEGVRESRSPIQLEKNRIIAYVRICHKQMKYHYPNASKVFVTWPFLWIVTIFKFLKTQKRNGTKTVLNQNQERTILAKHFIK